MKKRTYLFLGLLGLCGLYGTCLIFLCREPKALEAMPRDLKPEVVPVWCFLTAIKNGDLALLRYCCTPQQDVEWAQFWKSGRNDEITPDRLESAAKMFTKHLGTVQPNDYQYRCAHDEILGDTVAVSKDRELMTFAVQLDGRRWRVRQFNGFSLEVRNDLAQEHLRAFGEVSQITMRRGKRSIVLDEPEAIKRIVDLVELTPKRPCGCMHGYESISFVTPKGTIEASICSHCFDLEWDGLLADYCMPSNLYSTFESSFKTDQEGEDVGPLPVEHAPEPESTKDTTSKPLPE